MVVRDTPNALSSRTIFTVNVTSDPTRERKITHHADASLHVHTRVYHRPIVLRLQRERRCVLRVPCPDVDIQFGDSDVHSEVGEPLEVLLQSGGHLAQTEVRLEADAVNGDAICEVAFDDVVHGVGFGVDTFDTVVVDAAKRKYE